MRVIASALIISLLSGCATNLHTYNPAKPTQDNTALMYKQGVGSLSSTEADGDIVIYPTFKILNDGAVPTFSIFYVNKSGQQVDFSNANVKVFWRGQPYALYTFEERTAEIRSNKMKAQILMAVVGGLAAASAAQAASRQTTTYNSYGHIGRTNFNSHATLTTYNPAAGMLAGGAVTAATAVNINQIERYAANDEVRAQALLQQNIVAQFGTVDAQLMVKECCDATITPNDEMRFEVTVGAKTKTFIFNRNTITK